MSTYVRPESDGKKKAVTAIASSRGSQDANKLIRLNASGVLDASFVDSDVIEITVNASEAIAANRFVNLWDDSGTTKMRLADASNGRVAHGFTKEAVAQDADGKMFRSGRVVGLTGGTPGEDAYLGTAGQHGTPIDLTNTANQNGMNFVQNLGVWLSSDTVSFEHDEVLYS